MPLSRGSQVVASPCLSTNASVMRVICASPAARMEGSLLTRKLEGLVPPDRLPAASSVVATGPARAHVYRMTFSGDGREYFRIWIVNLLLTLITLGVYSAWAKVRKARYFWQNTRLDGIAFDYHGSPTAILRGRILAVALLALYSFGSQFSVTVGLVSIGVLIALAPWLLLRSQQFKLRNSSHRGLRFGFVGTAPRAYARFLPLLLIWLAPTALTLAAASKPMFVAIALLGLLSGLLFPLMHHELKSFQHRNATYGNRPFAFRSARWSFYVTYLLGGFIVLPVALVGGMGLGLLTASLKGEAGTPNTTVFFALGALMGVVAYLCVAPFFAVRLQKLVWDRTSLPGFRFRTEITVFRMFWLITKNMMLTIVSAGLYWPFAAVALARYRVEAFVVESDVPIEAIAASTQADERSAAGEGAADLFGLDIGL